MLAHQNAGQSATPRDDSTATLPERMSFDAWRGAVRRFGYARLRLRFNGVCCLCRREVGFLRGGYKLAGHAPCLPEPGCRTKCRGSYHEPRAVVRAWYARVQPVATDAPEVAYG